MVTTCETKRRFRTCGQLGVAVCQYCGRSFCEQHGGLLSDGQQVCARSRCSQKVSDLEQHILYKQTVAGRNHERLCGEAGCSIGAGGQCSKCDGLFCLSHLQQRVVEKRQGTGTMSGPGSLCRHCLKRRSLWARM